MDWLAAALLSLFLLGAVLSYLETRARRPGPPPYAKRPLLTQNELEFLVRLEAAMPELRFHAQVAMAAVIDVPKASYALRNTFSQKIIDYVAQTRATGEIIALIELDDRTHRREKDQARDAMTTAAGYLTVRFESRAKPTPEQIRQMLIEALTRHRQASNSNM